MIVEHTYYHQLYRWRNGERSRLGGVMVSVLASNAIDAGFEPRSGLIEKLVFVASPLSM